MEGRPLCLAYTRNANQFTRPGQQPGQRRDISEVFADIYTDDDSGRQDANLTVSDRRDKTAKRSEPAPAAEDQDVPRHVAIIMDGNGRWAQARDRPRTSGHSAGVDNVRRVLTHLEKRGVRFATVFAFSTENWSRPPAEVDFLLSLLREALRTEVDDLHNNNVRIMHIGDLDGLPVGFREDIEAAVALTAGNTGLTFCVAFNYGGRAEIVQATRRIAAEGIAPEAIDEAVISARLYSPELPDPDLVIRTGGEFRLSNFLLWQAAYAEFYSTSAPWPEFDEREIDLALTAFTNRHRRFGRVFDKPDDG